MGRHVFTALERRLTGILNVLSDELSVSERREVEGFIEASEYGVALETLCALLVEEKKRITPEAFAEISELADLMGIRSTTITNELQLRVSPG